MRLIVAIFLLLLPGLAALAQPLLPVYLHYTVEDGLPSSETYMVLQDSKGYIWLATDRGVARYDGHEFKVFSSQDGLSDNSVLGLHEDYRGRIWFFTYSTQIFYYENGKIHASPANPHLKKAIGKYIPCSIGVDLNDEVWVGFKLNYKHSPFFVIKPNGEIENWNLPESGPEAYGVIKELSSGDRVWGFGKRNTNNHLLLVSPEENYSYWKYQYPTPNTKQAIMDGLSMVSKPDSNMLFRWYNCIYRKGEEKVEHLLCQSNEHNTFGLLEDHQGNIWVATFEEGVKCYYKDQWDAPAFTLLDDKIVTWLYQDREGGIWLTTLNDGVYHIPAQNFRYLESKDYFEGRKIANMVGDQQRLMLSFFQGEIEVLDYDKTLRVKSEQLVNFAYEPGIKVFPELSQNWLLWGSDANGLSNASWWEEDKWTRIDQNGFYSIEQYDEESLIMLWKEQLLRYHLETEQVDTIATKDLPYSKSIFVDSKKKIWLLGVGGIYHYDDGAIKLLDTEDPRLQLRMTGVLEYNEHLFFASLGGGLVVYDGEKVWQITERDGLLSNLCNAITCDDEGVFWVSSNRGLSKLEIDIATKQTAIINYSRSNGLFSSEVNKVVILDSLVWVQHDQGLTTFPRYTDAHPTPTDGPEVYLQQLSINNRDTNLYDHYELNYQQNNLQLSYAGLSFQTGEKLLYRYRLLGLDSVWQYTQQNNLLYPKLPPGQFTFEVAARDYRGQWSEKPAQLSLLIRQPFWNTWWFLGLLFLLGFGLLQLFILLRFRIIQNRERLLRRSVEAEQKALQSQLTPHFIFNTLGSIQDLILSGQYRLASQNLTGVARLIRTVLNHSRRSSIPLSDEIEGLKNYLRLEQLRFGPELQWEIKVAKELDPDLLDIPPMLIQPFVENAIWHGLQKGQQCGGQIDILFSSDEEGIYCQVKDDGIGRSRSRALRSHYQHQALGMKIIEERIELLNKNRKTPFRLEIEDLEQAGEATGTCIHLFFPFNWN